MKKSVKLIFLFFFVLCSCDNKLGLKVESIEFNIIGAQVVDTKYNGREIYVEIGQEGGLIQFEATGKNSAHGFIYSVESDSHYGRDANNTDTTLCPFVFCEDDYLKVTVLSDDPHITTVQVKENAQASDRQFRLTFGAIQYYTAFIISQDGKK